jgi:hypothetical protein
VLQDVIQHLFVLDECSKLFLDEAGVEDGGFELGVLHVGDGDVLSDVGGEFL